MNATLLLCGLMLGGVWVTGSDPQIGGLGSTFDPVPSSDLDVPNESAGNGPLATPSSTGSGFGPSSSLSDGIGSSRMQSRPATAPVPTGGASGGAVNTEFPLAPFEGGYESNPLSPSGGAVPFAPTDPSAAMGGYPYAPPTGNAADMDAGRALSGGSRLSNPTSYSMPRAARPSYQPKATYDSFSAQQARLPRVNQSVAPTEAAAAATKPYADYSAPSSVSPYLQLGRYQGSTNVDNYNLYVKPQLDRDASRGQVSRQIRGLQTGLKNLTRQTQTLQGTPIPQYYMNYGGYYPSLGR